jgi:glycosyltransferase involved in cell wall biosynthesis
VSIPSLHFVIGAYPPSIGGAQIQTQVLARELARRGSSVRVSCHWRETRTDWLLGTTVRLPRGRRRGTDAGVPVDQVGLRGGRRLSDFLLAPLYYPLRSPVAGRFASRLDFDDGGEAICHIARMGREHLALRALRGARAGGRPVVVTPYHHERWSRRPDPVWRHVYRHADLVVAMTEAEVELLAGLGVDPQRVVVTGVSPVLADHADADETRAALGLPQGELIAFLGQQYPYKGVEIAIDAFERLVRSRPDATLVIAGPPTARTKRLVSRSPRRDRIRVVGPLTLEHKTGLLAASQALVLPSAQESFGGVILEAVAMGCPYVVSDLPQLREVHETVRFGAVARRDPGAFADTLEALLETAPVNRDRARERVLTRYSPRALADLHLDAYARLTPDMQD